MAFVNYGSGIAEAARRTQVGRRLKLHDFAQSPETFTTLELHCFLSVFAFSQDLF